MHVCHKAEPPSLHVKSSTQHITACLPCRIAFHDTASGMQVRALTITTRLGGFFLGLAWDRLSRADDTPARVQFRAAQLRHDLV